MSLDSASVKFSTTDLTSKWEAKDVEVDVEGALQSRRAEEDVEADADEKLQSRRTEEDDNSVDDVIGCIRFVEDDDLRLFIEVARPGPESLSSVF